MTSAKAYNAGLAKGVWQPIQFNDYGTPVVPTQKAAIPGQAIPGTHPLTVKGSQRTKGGCSQRSKDKRWMQPKAKDKKWMQPKAKGQKVDAVKAMPPENVASLRSFLGSIQFYSKFLPNLATITEPLHRLTKTGVPWSWGKEQAEAFLKLKDLLGATLYQHILIHPFPLESPVSVMPQM